MGARPRTLGICNLRVFGYWAAMVREIEPRSGATGKYKARSQFHAPPAIFDGCFTSFYHLELEVEGGGTVTDYLQPEWASIRFFAGASPWASIPGAKPISGVRMGVTGATTLPTQFRLGSARVWGIGFLPLGWARFFDGNASEYANQMYDGDKHGSFDKFTPLADVLCDLSVPVSQQYDAIAEHMERLAMPGRDDETIIRIHRALVDEGMTAVAEIAESAGISLRTLERLCGRYFGFTPKMLMRRQRFMRSLSAFMLDRDGTWSDVMDDHYHDQAQFTREFHQFMTMNPSAYAALPHPFLDAFIEARTRMYGSPAQTLDQP